MKAYQIFQNLSPELGRDLFHYLRTEEKEIYQTSIGNLAPQRKLRPIFVQRKPPEWQYGWLQKTCRLKGVDEVSTHLLQIYLMKAHQDLLVTFLDGVGIEHDGEGGADDLPDTIDKKKLKKTVDKLLEEKDPDLVALYLHVFQLQSPDGWEEIANLIESDDRLKLGESAEAEPESAEPAEAEPEPAKPEPVAPETPVEEDSELESKPDDKSE